MLDATILVLREVLEAALFISLLLALGAQFNLRWHWERLAIPLGLVASWLLSHFALDVAMAFDGIGQELANAGLLIVAIVSFIALATLLAPTLRQSDNKESLHGTIFFACCIVIVAASMAREGSEVWIYYSSYSDSPSAMSSALMGGLIGTGIGLSLCALVYYAFAFMSRRAFIGVFFVIAALVVGGLSMQLAKLGLQTGLLDSGPPVWDTNGLVNERSWTGQFLHALFGYDANPDRIQVGFYFGTLLVLLAGIGIRLLPQGVRRA
ncbi:MAG: hypothetical protein IPK97_15975 [Ahniella sp.]|nr:hypothetical protein [Ahniella sp.]